MLRERAKIDGVTIGREIEKLLRSDLQRRIGESLSGRELRQEEREWLDLGARTVGASALLDIFK
jgi:hypothetical protein